MGKCLKIQTEKLEKREMAILFVITVTKYLCTYILRYRLRDYKANGENIRVVESVSHKVKYKKMPSLMFFCSHNSCLHGFELCARKYQKLKNDFFLPYVKPTSK